MATLGWRRVPVSTKIEWKNVQVKYVSLLHHCLCICLCSHIFVLVCWDLFVKVISESSWPPGGSLINLEAFPAARKHNTELQPRSVQRCIARPVKDWTWGSPEGATLLIVCVSLCKSHSAGFLKSTGNTTLLHIFTDLSLFHKMYIAIYSIHPKPTHEHSQTHYTVMSVMKTMTTGI